MKLYYSMGACSLASDIVLREAGHSFTLEAVNLGTHMTETGADYYTINPKGYVPALKLDDGSILTEGVAILLYAASTAKQAHLTPEYGSMAWYRLVELLTFISSEIHKAFSPLFNKAITEEARTAQIEKLHKRFAFVENILSQSTFLTGETFTVADAYLYTVMRWSSMLNVDIHQYTHILRFMETVSGRPSVQEALAAEGAK